MHIKVPATSANMGPGFDSIGMALKLYNHIWVEEWNKPLSIKTRFKTEHKPPNSKHNLIYKSICRFYQEIGKQNEMPGIRIIQEDNIPYTRGLGSSAACVVGGLLAGNQLSKANLSRDDIITLAAQIEGHPDNSTPALVGGIVVGAFYGKKLEYIKIVPPKLNELKFAVLIPDFPLATAKARKVLPKKLSMEDAIFNSSRAALLSAALLQGDFDRLMVAMDDKFHQPYRMPIIPEMDIIFEKCKEFGCKGVFLSGAGPTIIAAYTDNHFSDKIQSFLLGLENKWEFNNFEIDLNGAEILD